MPSGAVSLARASTRPVAPVSDARDTRFPTHELRVLALESKLGAGICADKGVSVPPRQRADEDVGSGPALPEVRQDRPRHLDHSEDVGIEDGYKVLLSGS
jgi:hypothetical protein